MGKRWTEEEIKMLSSVKDRKELSLKLGRTEGAIKAKIKELGIGHKPTELWTTEEIEILKSCSTVKECIKLLPERNEEAIKSKRTRMNIVKNPRWTNEEIEFLLNNKDKEVLMKRFEGRTWNSIQSKRTKTLAKFKKKVK